jgi:PAN domain
LRRVKQSKIGQTSDLFCAYLTPEMNCQRTEPMTLSLARFSAIVCATLVAAVAMPSQAVWAQNKPTLERTTGMWVEGPGFDIKYGGSYDQCADRCLAESTCLMIEYYKPEKKCNMYNTERPLKTGGASIIGKKPAKPPVRP